jgi:phenylpropionate dioxygenase-like ring-hydroxylating dioxygenase large terminal subunit
MEMQDFWYPVCRSSDLSAGKPMSRKLWGRPLAIFRDETGAPHALEDLCSHRGAPLSRGKVVKGCLQCPYHGWRFGGDGRLAHIPGRVKGKKLPAFHAGRHATREGCGLVWVYGRAGVEPESEPHHFEGFGQPGYGWGTTEFHVDAELFSALDNFLDSQHPPFVHPGLIYDEDSREELEIRVRKLVPQNGNVHAAGVEAEFCGEPPPDRGLIGRIFAGKCEEGDTLHMERFIAPATHQNEYRVKDRAHLYVNMILSPVEAGRTTMFMLFVYRLPLPRWIVHLPLKAFLWFTVRQDRDIVESQQRASAAAGRRPYQSTELDSLSVRTRQFLDRLAEVEDAREIPVAETSFRGMF